MEAPLLRVSNALTVHFRSFERAWASERERIVVSPVEVQIKSANFVSRASLNRSMEPNRIQLRFVTQQYQLSTAYSHSASYAFNRDDLQGNKE